MDNPETPNAFEEFKKDLNNQCELKWKTTKLLSEVNFLDLTISINKMVISQQGPTRKK